jgi:hypothetical protein
MWWTDNDGVNTYVLLDAVEATYTYYEVEVTAIVNNDLRVAIEDNRIEVRWTNCTSFFIFDIDVNTQVLSYGAQYDLRGNVVAISGVTALIGEQFETELPVFAILIFDVEFFIVKC